MIKKKCHNCRGKGVVSGNRKSADKAKRMGKCYYCHGIGIIKYEDEI